MNSVKSVPSNTALFLGPKTVAAVKSEPTSQQKQREQSNYCLRPMEEELQSNEASTQQQQHQMMMMHSGRGDSNGMIATTTGTTTTTTTTTTMTTPISLEQCLLGEQSLLVQRQLLQHNYIQWFENDEAAAAAAAAEITRNQSTIRLTKNHHHHRHRQRSDTSMSSHSSASHLSIGDDEVKDAVEVNKIELDDLPAVEDFNDQVDGDDDFHRNDGVYNHPSVLRNFNSSYASIGILEDFAPVSTKWSDCASQATDEVDNLMGAPHQIDIPILRKIVSTGCGMDDDDDDDDLDHGSHRGNEDQPYYPSPIRTKKGCRALAWRVLLGYLPTDTSQWIFVKDTTTKEKVSVVQQQRELYVSLATDLFTTVSDVTIAQHANELRARPRNAATNTHAAGHRRRHHHHIKCPTSNASSSGGSVSSRSRSGENDIMPLEYLEQNDCTSKAIPSNIQQHWKENLLDPNILERCLTNNELNTLRIEDYFFNSPSNAIGDDRNSPSLHDKADGIMNDFVENVLLLDEIRKDVVRTHPDLSFFLDPYQNVGKRRYAALERILFVWSKYNKGVRYVQGMNEIVGILYYVLANDLNDEWAIWAEADTYWLLNSLLGEMRDVFIAGFDEHDTGIQGRLLAMQALLQRHDPEVAEHLQELGIEISFYAIRWWTTLLCREFLLPDTIRLWDSMFASTHKDNFLRYVCVIMVMSLRDRILKGDFTTCLQLLHSFPPTSIERLLEASRALWIYESQISVACHRGGLTLHQALTTIDSPKALIMGFGFVNGTPPASFKNPKDMVGEIKGATVQIEAKMRRSAHELFGRAKGWYSKYSSSSSKDPATTKNEEAKTLEVTRQGDSALIDEDDVYLKAFLDT
jgi:Rab-GTPase-TBC domain